MRLISIGEVLWDVIGEAEYLGGAPLNFAAHARKLGHEVFLISAVGDDERGRCALERLKQLGVSTEFVQVLPGQATGTAVVELDPNGKPMFEIVRPAAYDHVVLTPEMQSRIAQLEPRWIYLGTLYHMGRTALPQTQTLLEKLPDTRRLYDVNLRDGQWNLGTVEELAKLANLIKLSGEEAEFLDGSLNADGNEGSLRHFCQRWSSQYCCKTICVTFGEGGCAIYQDGDYINVPGHRVQVADTVGAGDAFAAAFVHGLEEGWNAQRCGVFANAVGALVASRSGAIPDWQVSEVLPMIRGKL